MNTIIICICAAFIVLALMILFALMRVGDDYHEDPYDGEGW